MINKKMRVPEGLVSGFGLGRVLPEARKFWLGRVGFSGLVVDSFEFTRIFRVFFTELR